MKHFEQELPQGYVAAKVVDATKQKTAVVFTVLSLVIAVVVFVLMWLAIFGLQPLGDSFEKMSSEGWKSFLPVLVFFVAYLTYVVCHELTHGLVYKLFTKQKLTFGLTLAVAYCGVPNIYVYRTAALTAVLAPFVLFTPVFLLPALLLADCAYALVFGALFAFHVGGCVGDLYCAILYFTKFRNSNTLMRDTGPQQTFYVVEQTKE